MKRLPLHVAMKEKSLSLGTLGMLTNAGMFEIFAAVGYNHVILDHMFSSLDWSATNALCLAARHHGLAPMLRVQTYPWSPEPGGDMGAVSEVARARMNGAAGAVVSIGSVAQLKAIMRVATDIDHCGVPGYYAAPAFKNGGEKAVEALLPVDLRDFPIVAYIEKIGLVEELEEIVSVEGLKAIGFGIHDISYTLGHPFEVEHPDVWKVIDRAVTLAKPRGISVWTNTGYIYTHAEETAARIKRLYERGVDTIQLQGPNQYLKVILGEITERAFSSI